MKRNRRDSTIEKSLQLKKKLQERELKREIIRTQKLLGKNSAEDSVQEEQESVAFEPVQDKVQIEDVDTSEKDTTSEGSGSADNEYWFDTSCRELIGEGLSFVHSPETPPTDLFPQDPDNWSSVNRFFPEGSEPSPLPETRSLENILEENLDTQVQDPSESSSEETVIARERRSLESTASPTGIMMDVADFNRKYKELQRSAAQIDLLIGNFNKETVNVLDKDTYKDDLREIFDKVVEMESKFSSAVDGLGQEVQAEQEAFNQASKLFKDTKQRASNNACEVKARILQLIREETSLQATAQKETETKKISLKIGHASAKFTKLKEEVSRMPEIKDMTESKLKSFIVESKNWKQELKTFASLKEAIEVESVAVDVSGDDKGKLTSSYDEMLEAVTKKITELSVKDEELGLHSFSKAKKTIEYPSKFSGNLGEDVFRFIKDFREAISADEVRTADQVKTLLKYLDGDAKSVIGEHQKTLKGALDLLEENYGVPRLIVEKYTKDYDKNFGNYKKWGSNGSKERNNAINKTLDLIRNLQDMAKTHKHLSSEI